MSIPLWKTPAVSKDGLQKAYESFKDATATIKTEHTENGSSVSGIIDMTQGLQTVSKQVDVKPELTFQALQVAAGFEKTLSFWANQVLPVNEVFTPDCETNTTPRSKLDNPVNV